MTIKSGHFRSVHLPYGRSTKKERRTLIQRAGRIIRPAGKLILSMNNNEELENELLHSLGLLKALGA